MSDTLIVLKPSRLGRIHWKSWLQMLCIFVLSFIFLIGSFTIERLTAENTRELTAPISSSRIIPNRSRHGSDTAVLVIDVEEYRIPIRSRELRQLLETHPTGNARVIVTEDGSIAELEYDGQLYHTLKKENLRRQTGRILALFTGLILLTGSLFFLWVELLSHSIVILRKRPKNTNQRILIEK